jgi:malate synthase
MTHRTFHGGLQVATVLNDLLAQRICPGTDFAPEAVWAALEKIVADLAPRVRALLAKRDDLQVQIDGWHHRNAGTPHDAAAYQEFLRSIGYLLPEGPDFSATTANVDAEVALIAGPQLVVPVTNARYALNAANARWGSLYDALYGPKPTAAKNPTATIPSAARRSSRLLGNSWIKPLRSPAAATGTPRAMW